MGLAKLLNCGVQNQEQVYLLCQVHEVGFFNIPSVR
jgi:hypothetical protein